MSRVRTQEDFIKKAQEIHGTKYDYSQVKYVSTQTPVTIICPIHGPFQQKPFNHLRGHDCPICGRDKTKTGRDEFIRRARAVHGNRYDYSRVVYKRTNEKVEIICSVHGSFWQTPQCHISSKQNCPKCAAEEGGQKRRGDNNPMRKPETKAKARKTCLERYGAKTYAESLEGRQKLHDIVTSPEIQAKMEATCQARYGAKLWSASDIGREKLHELMSSVEMQQKIVSGYQSAYGVDHYMQTDEGRAKARAYMSEERQAKIRASFIAKYGVTNMFDAQEFRVKKAFYMEKGWATKRAHGTFSTSRPEESLYRLLCDKFGKDNVLRQYVDAVRYPFHCDFYVRPLDLFIELNASWTHGGHWFDENNPLDVEIRDDWYMRAVRQKSLYYAIAIDVWTDRDLLKKRIAEANHLNYLVFWDNKLTDAVAWLASI